MDVVRRFRAGTDGGEAPGDGWVRVAASAPGACNSYPDLADVRGQTAARRALEIAAAGSHSVLMVGPPGSGKSMLAQRFAGLLPPMTTQEALESAAIASLAGRFDLAHWARRPTYPRTRGALTSRLHWASSPPAARSTPRNSKAMSSPASCRSRANCGLCAARWP